MLAVAGQWWQKGDRGQARHVLIAAGFSFLLGLALNQLILLFVHRMRPYDAGISHLLIAPSADPSFPSDHPTVAIAAAFLLHGMRRTGAWFLAAFRLCGGAAARFVRIHSEDVVSGDPLVRADAAIYRALQDLRRAPAIRS